MATIRAVALAAALSGLATPAFAGPPFVTDDPEPVEYRAWEVNYALTGTHGQAQTAGFLPQADINYGAAPGVQLHVMPQMAYNTSTGAIGMGDTELGVKYRLTPESENPADWMVSIYPLYEIPTGNIHRNLGAGAQSVYLPVWLQTTRGGWTFYGGAGYWIASGAGNRNSWAGGWVALYQFTPDLQFGGEIFGRTATLVDGRSAAGFNLGGTYRLAKDYNLLFSGGRGLINAYATNQLSGYLGLQVAY